VLGSSHDVIVIAQHFQPLHAGHRVVLEQARQIVGQLATPTAAQVVLLCLGAQQPRSLRAPWTTEERVQQLTAMAGGVGSSTVVAVRDIPYDPSRWRSALLSALADIAPTDARFTLLSDAEPLTVWPKSWPRLELACALASGEALLREQIIWREEPDWSALASLLKPEQQAEIRQFLRAPAGATLRREAQFMQEFRESWQHAPYPPVLVTTDGVVTCGEHVLLVRRGRAPGKDLWALPGGFLEQDETLAECVRREVEEETGLCLAAAQCCAARVFDAPQRSLRGRTITHAFHYDLAGRQTLPTVRGGDDAAEAAWFKSSELASSLLFEDHYAILQVMIGLA
jgi:bifunctional NMN adenylyltransferase/nudix hydrolase